MKTEAEVGAVQPQPRMAQSQQKGEKARKGSPLELAGEYDPAGTLISDLWPLELWEDKFLLFQAPPFVVIGQSSPRKFIQPTSPSGAPGSALPLPSTLCTHLFLCFFMWFCIYCVTLLPSTPDPKPLEGRDYVFCDLLLGSSISLKGIHSC